MTAKRAGLYVRISQQDVKVPKVANQVADCRLHAAARRYNVVDIYEDDGISATTGRVRPGFRRLIADIEAGKLDVIVAVDEDRLSRTMADTIELQAVSAAAGVTWDTLRGGEVDPTQAQGEAFSQIRAVMSRLEVRQKVDRQKTANRHRRMSGQPMTGTRPFGFELDRIGHREHEAKELAWAYTEVISNGGKLYPVLRDWNARGVLTSRGNKWSYATLQQLLRRASNAGLVAHDGEILDDVTAVWKAIVPREDYEHVLRLLNDPRRRLTKKRHPVHLLPSLATCGVCGSVMRSSGSTNTVGERIYRCATKISAQSDGRRHTSVKISDADQAVSDALTYYLGDLLHQRRAARERVGSGDAIREAVATVALLTSRLTELGTEYDDGDLTRSEYVTRRERLQAKLARAQAALSELEAAHVPSWPADVPRWERDRFDRDAFRTWWENEASLEERRMVIMREIESIRVMPGRAPARQRMKIAFRDGRTWNSLGTILIEPQPHLQELLDELS